MQQDVNVFGLGPVELIIIAGLLAGMAATAGVVLWLLVRAAFPSTPKQCPHCGKDLRS